MSDARKLTPTDLDNPAIRKLVERGSLYKAPNWTCPSHDDRAPSLTVSVSGGHTLLHCHAGCSYDEILRSLDLPVKKNPVARTHDYEDKSGVVIARKLKLQDGSFCWERPGVAGEWVSGLGGVKVGPYRAQALSEGRAAEQPVWICEGERDADAAAALGQVATSPPHGVGSWKPLWSKGLRGLDVTVVRDKDAPGKKHGNAVAASLVGIAKSVRLVEPTEGFKDLSDHLRGGKTIDELVEIPLPDIPFNVKKEAVAPLENGGQKTANGGTEPTFLLQVTQSSGRLKTFSTDLTRVSAADLLKIGEELGELPFLPLLTAPGYIVEGWVTLLAGFPKCGKTTLLRDTILKWLALGRTVLYVSEESEKQWARRLGSGSWDGCNFLFGLGATPEQLREAIFQGDEQIVILDTVRSLCGITNENDNGEMNVKLTPWIAQARQGNKTLLLVHHMRKGAGEFGEGISGGHAVFGMVDTALELHRVKNHPNRRVVKSYSRLLDAGDLTYELKTDGTLGTIDAPWLSAIKEQEKLVRETVPETPTGRDEIWHRLPEPRIGRDRCREILEWLARQGDIERDPPIAEGDQKGKKYSYWRSANLPNGYPPYSRKVGSEPELPNLPDLPDLPRKVDSAGSNGVLMTIAEKFKGTEPAYPEPPGLQPHERCSRHAGIYWERPTRNGGGFVCTGCHPVAVNDAEIRTWVTLIKASAAITN